MAESAIHCRLLEVFGGEVQLLIHKRYSATMKECNKASRSKLLRSNIKCWPILSVVAKHSIVPFRMKGKGIEKSLFEVLGASSLSLQRKKGKHDHHCQYLYLFKLLKEVIIRK